MHALKLGRGGLPHYGLQGGLRGEMISLGNGVLWLAFWTIPSAAFINSSRGFGRFLEVNLQIDAANKRLGSSFNKCSPCIAPKPKSWDFNDYRSRLVHHENTLSGVNMFALRKKWLSLPKTVNAFSIAGYFLNNSLRGK